LPAAFLFRTAPPYRLPVFLPGFLSCCLTNRGCEITVSHDTKQGEDGGTITETIIYDQATASLKGSPDSFDWWGVTSVVSECPKEEEVE
jgi:hypothetical protein